MLAFGAKQRETADCETPAARATSYEVGRLPDTLACAAAGGATSAPTARFRCSRFDIETVIASNCRMEP